MKELLRRRERRNEKKRSSVSQPQLLEFKGWDKKNETTDVARFSKRCRMTTFDNF
jgi:hypothetical protein